MRLRPTMSARAKRPERKAKRGYDHLGAPVRTTIRPPTPSRARAPQRGDARQARIAAIALGAWLCLSAFLWPHGDASRANSFIVGLLVVVGSAWGLRNPLGRVAGALVAAWLLASTLLILPRAELTFWNNLIVGATVLALSFVPRTGRTRTS